MGQVDRPRPVFQNPVQNIRRFGQSRGYQPTPHSFLSGFVKLGFDPFKITIAASDQTKPARAGHGSGQPSARNAMHRGQHHWAGQPKLTCQSRINHLFLPST